MKHSILLKLHLFATIVALITISTFFLSSLYAEILGETTTIKAVKKGILLSLPLLIVTMPLLGLTGQKLAYGRNHPILKVKMKRMKMAGFNGIILISLAIFLYYKSHHGSIDNTFLIAQVAEFSFGFMNLVLIVLNAFDGQNLSSKGKSQHGP